MATERSRDNDNTLLLTLALDYARQGWPVFPVQWITASGICSCNEGAACGNKSGKHPKTPKGFHDATLDEKQIRAWWRQWPQANIGGVTGQTSGRFVIDRDMKPDSDASFAQLLADACDLPLTLTHTTGSGGMHYIFRHPEGVAIASATGGSVGKYLDQYPGVDTRGDLGYIVLPPSRNLIGRYSVAMPHDLADLPLSFIDLFTTIRAQPQATAYGHNTPLAAWPQSSQDDANYWVHRAVSKAVEGTRNETGMWLAVQLRDAQVSQSEAESAIHSYIAQVTTAASPFTERDIMPTLRNVYRTPARDPARSQTPTPIRAQVAPIAPLPPIAPPTPIRQPQHDDSPPVDDRDNDESEDVPPHGVIPLSDGSEYDMHVSCTDIGNALRLVARYGDIIRYCKTWNTWLTWNGKRWELDTADVITTLAKNTARMIWAEVAQCEDKDAIEAMSKWAKASANVARIKAMITLSQPDCAVSPDVFDRDPWVLNCQNGTIDLRTGDLLLHRQADNITKICPFEYDPSATSPLWDDYLERFFPDRGEVVMYLQRVAGYALTGFSNVKALFILEGVGNSGKTTFVETIKAVMGTYAGKLPATSLIVMENKTMNTDIAELKGVRLAVASELEEGKYLAEAKVKDLTGGGTQVGERKYEHMFNFDPTHTLILDTNHMPRIRGTDNAIWNRLKRIQFLQHIEDTAADEHYNDRLRGELSGVFNWMLAGCMTFQRGGIADPPVVKEAVASYRADMDIYAQWLQECCIVGSQQTCYAKQLYNSYTQWCIENGEAQAAKISDRGLSVKHVDHGFKRDHDRGGSVWYGLGLKILSSDSSPFS